MYVCTCMYIIYMYIRKSTNVLVYLHTVYTHVCTYVHVHTYSVHTCMYIRTCTCIYNVQEPHIQCIIHVGMYMQVYIHMYIIYNMHMYVRMYTHYVSSIYGISHKKVSPFGAFYGCPFKNYGPWMEIEWTGNGTDRTVTVPVFFPVPFVPLGCARTIIAASAHYIAGIIARAQTASYQARDARETRLVARWLYERCWKNSSNPVSTLCS